MPSNDRTRNLNLYFELVNQLQKDDQMVFDVSLIGALSPLIDEEVWDRALDLAARRLIERGTKLKMPTIIQ